MTSEASVGLEYVLKPSFFFLKFQIVENLRNLPWSIVGVLNIKCSSTFHSLQHTLLVLVYPELIMSSDSSQTLSFHHLTQHNNQRDCWIAVHSKIYDITDYLDSHPGGSSSSSYNFYLIRKAAYLQQLSSNTLEETPQLPTMRFMRQASLRRRCLPRATKDFWIRPRW